MSNLIVPNVGKPRLLSLSIGLGGMAPLTVKLFKNLIVPTNAIVLASFNEADFTNYVSQNLANGVVAGALDAGNRAVASWDTLTFTKNGAIGNDIYGYWVETMDNILVWYEQFDQIVPMQADGAQLVMTPKFTGRSQYTNG